MRINTDPPNRVRLLLVGIVFALALGTAVISWHGILKPLPVGVSVQTPIRRVENVRFLSDLTWVDPQGTRHVDQEIFDSVFEIIRGARSQITLDFFLFNAYQGAQPEETRALCAELTDALVDQKRAYPEIEISLITDPINSVYGGLTPAHLEKLEQHDVEVLITDLNPLRDSNALYSSLWRWFIRPFGEGRPGIFPNPFGGDSVSLRSDLQLLNFKANHRKTILADSPDGWTALVTSANPHDGSSAHGNVAVQFTGPAVADLLETERAVALFSEAAVPSPINNVSEERGSVALRIVTEGKIGDALDEVLATAQRGDQIAVAVFYLSDRRIITALIDAHARGVAVRVLLDPNKDAFGIEKNGIPNRSVAWELQRSGVPLRWCDTHGEQCHAKMLLARHGHESTLILGSANFTRRNLRDLNLETNVWLSATLDDPVMAEAWSYFEQVWSNEHARRFSVPYEHYADESRIKNWIYRLGEFSGIGTY